MKIGRKWFLNLALPLIPMVFAGVVLGGDAPLQPEQGGLTISAAVILGIVEGLTEYLPVSSTGHLLFAQQLLGLADSAEDKAIADSYAIIIQFGAILAVLGLYRQRVARIIGGLLGRDSGGLHIGICIVLAFLPAALAGLMGHSLIKTHLFGPWPIVFAWAAGGCLLLLWRKGNASTSAGRLLEDMTFRQAMLIGLFQCLALWPGMSRSLVTIVGGIIIGLPLPLAVEFSFLLGGVTLAAASFYEIYDNGAAVSADYGLGIAGLGIFCSFIAAAAAIKWLLVFLQSRDMTIFGYYRLAISLVATGYLLR